jgi:hypothetical protein
VAKYGFVALVVIPFALNLCAQSPLPPRPENSPTCRDLSVTFQPIYPRDAVSGLLPFQMTIRNNSSSVIELPRRWILNWWATPILDTGGIDNARHGGGGGHVYIENANITIAPGKTYQKILMEDLWGGDGGPQPTGKYRVSFDYFHMPDSFFKVGGGTGDASLGPTACVLHGSPVEFIEP